MYQCPGCGGRLVFDIPSQQLMCDHCSTKYDPYAISKEQDAEESHEYDVTVFKCPNCGGEILSTDNTAANFCSFCGASTILTSRVSKQQRPGYIIPFSKTKEDCKQAYKKMVRHAWFAPKELKDEKFIDGFRGIYMPYWTYYITQKGPMCLSGSKSHRRGDYIYTDYYDITGDLDCQYKGLSYDASSSFDDSISEAIAPYDVKNMNPFTPSMLSGFYADTADVAPDVYRADAKNVAVDETYSYVKRSAHLGSVQLDNYQGDIERRLSTKVVAQDRTMFPVWFLSYRNKDRVAYATVNGQTGKAAADLPVSLMRYFIGSVILAIPIFLMLNSSFTLRPKTTLGIASIIALFTIILYVLELKKIYKKDRQLDDKGRMYAGSAINVNESPGARRKREEQLAGDIADAIDKGRREARAYGRKNKRRTTRTNMAVVTMIISLMCCVFPMLYVYLQMMSIFYGSGDIGAGFSISVICLITGIVLTLVNHKTFKMITNKKISGNIGSLAAMAIASVVLWINPVSDLYYYGAVIAELIAIMYTIMDLIRYYNVLATRKLPQFDNYSGGDDNA